MSRQSLILCFALLASHPSALTAAMQNGRAAPVEDVWQPARTPPGGTSWTLLEATKVVDRRDANGMIFSKPAFTPAMRALAGKRIKLAGWMMPLENAGKQKHFVLLGYPPGCPFHVHAMPNQFVEIMSTVAVPVDDMRPIVMTGTLQLTGQDESGIFYKLVDARPG